jgi:hypothetical protein
VKGGKCRARYGNSKPIFARQVLFKWRKKAATPSGNIQPVPGLLIELAGADRDDAKQYQERDLREALRRIHAATEETDA